MYHQAKTLSKSTKTLQWQMTIANSDLERLLRVERAVRTGNVLSARSVIARLSTLVMIDHNRC